MFAGLSAVDCGSSTEPGKQESTSDTAQQALVFDSFTKSDLSGEFTNGSGKLNFVSTWTDDVKNVEFIANGKVAGKINHNVNGDGLFVADSMVTPEARALIQGLLENIKKLDEQKVVATYGQDVTQTAMGLLISYTELFTTAPINHPVHYQRVWAISQDPNAMKVESWGGDGITYLWQCSRSSSRRIATAYWTDWRGYMQATVACGISAPACEGRCGAGCPCNSWYCVNKYYTQDCLEHDVCLDNNPSDSSIDPFAANCGDEFGDATDDTLFGSSSGW